MKRETIRPKRPAALAAALLLTGAAATTAAQAASIYSYRTDQTDYPVLQGQTTVVTVYLREAWTGSSQLVSEDGLVGADVQVARSGGDAVANVVAMAGNTAAFTFGASYTPSASVPDPGAATAGFALSTFAVPGPTGSAAADGVRELLLGTFTLKASADATGVATFDVEDLPGGSNTLTNLGTLLDETVVPASFSVTVSAVPEPAAGAALLATGAAALVGRWRRPR